MRVFLVSGYHTGSHAAWADGYAAASGHEVHLVTMPGAFWQWRLTGGFVTLAEQIGATSATVGRPDAILTTSLVDVAGLRGMLPPDLRSVPMALYMHENQITYPAISRSRTERLYGLLTWTSLLAADTVAFNSEYHRDALAAALPGFLREFPDERHGSRIDEAMDKARVLPVGCDLAGIATGPKHDPPLILWNHRWDADKDPGAFFRIIDLVEARGVDYRLALLGERFVNQRSDHDAAAVAHRIVADGYLERPDYLAVLAESAVVVSTAHQEFFGVAVTEAMAAGAFPVLPNRLVYPERVPPRLAGRVLYRSEAEAAVLLERALGGRDQATSAEISGSVQQLDWSVVAPTYDDWLMSTAAS